MSVARIIELVIAVREEVGSHPLILFAAALGILAILQRLRPIRDRNVPWPRTSLWLALGAIAVYGMLVTWYLVQPQYADPAEPTIAAVAWLFEVGRPIYHLADSAERYAHIYGPLAFIVPAWCLSLLGPGILTSKIHGAIAGLLSVAVVFALARTAVDTRRAFLVAGLFGGICLMFQGVSFWNRPDSLLVLASGAALLAVVTLSHDVLAGVALGLATGVLIDLKITGALYALPAFALLIGTSRITAAVLAAGVSAVVGVMPFVAYSNVSLTNYMHWLSVSASNGLVFQTLRQNAEWALFLMIPLAPVLMSSTPDRRERWLLAGLAAGIPAIVLAASKPGAGVYHLLPFVPAVLYTAIVTWWHRKGDVNGNGHIRRGIIAFTVAVGVVATLQSVYFIHVASRTRGTALVQDLERFVRLHPDKRIEMGYSTENEPFPYVRPILTFHQGTYLLDAPAIQELQMSGIEWPASTTQAVENCVVDFWLIPRNGTPFSLQNRYPSTHHIPLFPESFRIAFDRAYRRTTSTDHFDVWACRVPKR